MTAKRWLGATALLWMALLGGPARAEDSRLSVVAIFSILGGMVKSVGGDKVNVTVLVGPDADTHTYQPTPSDTKAIATAKLLVINGLGLEGWLDRLRGATKSSATVVVATKGVTPLAIEEEEKARESGKSKFGKARHVTDPHAWQSLTNGQVYVANIVAGLAGVDPANANYYEHAGAAYKRQLAELEGRVKSELALVPEEKRRVITTHDAFQYFGKAYGIAFIAPEGISTENEPSAGGIAKLERQIKHERINALFLENVINARLIEQIAKDTGAVVGPPLYSDALSRPEGPANTYVKMFEYNVATLKEGMQKN
jgi:zinc/manganese transport system substrate-binding protein